jgi:hypothetical protein
VVRDDVVMGTTDMSPQHPALPDGLAPAIERGTGAPAAF